MVVGRLALSRINELTVEDFISVFGNVYEASPGLAQRASGRRPYSDRRALFDAFEAALDYLDEVGFVELLRLHPPLGAATIKSAESRSEQLRAGLSTLDPCAEDRIRHLVVQYADRFGFPFVIAVTHRSVEDIEAALATRFNNHRTAELRHAKIEVRRIGGFRLDEIVASA